MNLRERLIDILPRLTSFAAIVVLPLALMGVYYGLIASDRYTSEAVFAIEDDSDTGPSLDFGGFAGAVGSTFKDERIMETYLLSGDMLAWLDRELDLRRHYESGEADVFSRLAEDATWEEFLAYYQSRVDVYFDDTSGLLSVEVQAFDRDFATRLLETMLERAEAFVNQISHQLALAQQRFVEEQLVKSQTNLKLAKQSLLIFQDNNRIYSPEQQGQALTAVIDSLESELIKEKAGLKQLLSYQNKNAPQVVATQARIDAIGKQIADEKGRLVGDGEEKLNDLMADFTDLELEFEFAKDAYASTLAALEQSRAEASKKLKHLVVVSSPSEAEEAKYPRRMYILVTAAIVLLLLYGIARMVVATVREHQD